MDFIVAILIGLIGIPIFLAEFVLFALIVAICITAACIIFVIPLALVICLYIIFIE